jgi:hypothetical protein
MTPVITLSIILCNFESIYKLNVISMCYQYNDNHSVI